MIPLSGYWDFGRFHLVQALYMQSQPVWAHVCIIPVMISPVMSGKYNLYTPSGSNKNYTLLFSELHTSEHSVLSSTSASLQNSNKLHGSPSRMELIWESKSVYLFQIHIRTLDFRSPRVSCYMLTYAKRILCWPNDNELPKTCITHFVFLAVCVTKQGITVLPS